MVIYEIGNNYVDILLFDEENVHMVIFLFVQLRIIVIIF